ncbi:MAG TPA: efflux RND transporter periplasmic adaptor subunit [Thermoanaerobaculia bacterium]|jgi:RND family efflux transporter MFP subunit
MSEKIDRLNELKIDRADIEKTRSGGGLGLALTALLLVLLGGGGWWWYRQSQIAVVEIAPVETVAPATSSTVLDASGYVTARLRATVSSKITGKIVEVMIEEGMEVAAGQVLARLDDATQQRQSALAEAELAAARSRLHETAVRLAEARVNLGRSEQLVAADVASQSALDAARAEVDSLAARLDLGREEIAVAEKRLAVAQQDIADTVVRSPFAGVVVTKNAQPGEMISPISAGGGFTRTGIGTVVDMSSLEIEVDVNEAYIKRVTPRQAVEATLDAYPDWKIPATVITSVPTADRQKATVRVRIAFEALDPRILPDMGVKVSFLDPGGDGSGPAASGPQWRVPARALRQDGGQDVVFVVRDGRAERRAVAVGARQGEAATLTAGVSAGEQVVVRGPEDLADGDPVKLKNP